MMKRNLLWPVCVLSFVVMLSLGQNTYGKIDVWDFGAEQLDASVYNNHLNVDVINAWYDKSITPGTSGKVLPGFTAGALSWVGGSNDRLRTTNTSLTRYDENLGGAAGYTGRIYVNASAATIRFPWMRAPDAASRASHRANRSP